MNEKKIRGKIEEESLKDLEKVVKISQKWGLRLVLIGGYAVKSYTKGYRYTKDIDFVTVKKEMGKLIALLKTINYKVEETEFGLKGNKSINKGTIDFHISVDEVFDVSTGKRYPVDKSLLKDSKTRAVSGFYTEKEVKAFVIPLEDLLILKLMTKQRKKDIIDSVSLIIDRWEDLNLNEFKKKCTKAGLEKHIRDNILSLISLIKKNELEPIWFNITAQELMRKTKTKLKKKLRTLEDHL